VKLLTKQALTTLSGKERAQV